MGLESTNCCYSLGPMGQWGDGADRKYGSWELSEER